MVEMMAVIVIWGILISLLFPRLLVLIDNKMLETYQYKFRAHLNQVKMHAMYTEELSRITFPFYYDDYYIVRLPGEGIETVHLPEGMYFSMKKIGFGGTDITFESDGVPREGGATIGISNQHGESRYIIVAAISGRIRLSKSPP